MAYLKCPACNGETFTESTLEMATQTGVRLEEGGSVDYDNAAPMALTGETTETIGYQCQTCGKELVYVDGKLDVPISQALIEDRLFDMAPPYTLKLIELSRVRFGGVQNELAKHLLRTIEVLGVIQSVVVVDHSNEYEVVAGLRRLIAAKQLGKLKVPALVFNAEIPRSVINLIVLAENMNRIPNLAKEAELIGTITAERNWTAKQLADHLGVSVKQIRAREHLLGLIPTFFQQLKDGKLRMSVARKLCKLPAGEQQELAGEERITLSKIEDVLRRRRTSNIPDQLFSLEAVA